MTLNRRSPPASTLTFLVDAIIGFGSNLGEREVRIAEAAERLGIFQMSPLYETAPMYVLDQPPFLNAVGVLRTDDGPVALLRKLKKIEAAVGRLPRMRNGPREIDLDLLAYGKLQFVSRVGSKTRLHVPHPRLVERRFVLQPLYDLNRDFVLPGLGAVRELLTRTQDQADQVVRFGSSVGSSSAG